MYFDTTADGFWGQCPADYLRVLVDQQLHEGMKTSVFVLGDPYDPGSTGVVVFHMPPGKKLPRHSHGCARFETIIQGSMESESGPLGVGDVMYSEADVPYGPHVAGPEGYTVVEVFSNLPGMYQLTFHTADGPLYFDAVADGGKSPERPTEVG
jgi:anti-sigma factor ChrR (cupin superfamily)